MYLQYISFYLLINRDGEYIIFEILVKLFESIVSKDHAASQDALYLRKEDVVREVNGFFGFAVSSCLKTMEKKKRFAEFD